MSDLSKTLTLALRTGDRDAWNEVVRSDPQGYLPTEPPLEVEVAEGTTTRWDIRLAE